MYAASQHHPLPFDPNLLPASTIATHLGGDPQTLQGQIDNLTKQTEALFTAMTGLFERLTPVTHSAQPKPEKLQPEAVMVLPPTLDDILKTSTRLRQMRESVEDVTSRLAL